MIIKRLPGLIDTFFIFRHNLTVSRRFALRRNFPETVPAFLATVSGRGSRHRAARLPRRTMVRMPEQMPEQMMVRMTRRRLEPASGTSRRLLGAVLIAMLKLNDLGAIGNREGSITNLILPKHGEKSP